MPKRSYTDEEKATALAMLDANDGNLSRTSRETTVPITTLKGWRDGRGTNGAVSQLRQVKKLELADLFENHIRAGMPLAEGKIKDASYRDTMTGMGIAADKMALLRGNQPQTQGRVNVFVQMNQEVKDTPGFPRK